MELSHYRELIENVKELHGTQMDYSGREYWLHCQRVFEICSLTMTARGHDMTNIFKSDEYDDLIITALFHDVLEDVEDGHKKLLKIFSFNEAKNFPRLGLLTKPKNFPYLDYIKNIIKSNDWIVILVKFADMLDHVERLPFITDEAIQKRLSAKYVEPLKLLRFAVEVRINYLPNNIAKYILPSCILPSYILNNPENQQIFANILSNQLPPDPEIEQAFTNGLGDFITQGFSD